jgi:hypothetical protein
VAGVDRREGLLEQGEVLLGGDPPHVEHGQVVGAQPPLAAQPGAAPVGANSSVSTPRDTTSTRGMPSASSSLPRARVGTRVRSARLWKLRR